MLAYLRWIGYRITLGIYDLNLDKTVFSSEPDATIFFKSKLVGATLKVVWVLYKNYLHTLFYGLPSSVLSTKLICPWTYSTEIFVDIESDLLHVQGGDSGQMDSRAQRYCGSYFDSSEASTRNGQVTSECRQEDEGKH